MKIFLSLFWITLLLSMYLSVSSAQSVYYVNATTGNNTSGNGTAVSPFKTITKALSVSTLVGDSIKVSPGTYTTALGETFPIEMLTGRKLIGTAGAQSTIILGGYGKRVFNCVTNSAATVIQGFTITGGYVSDTTSGGATSKGGGIYIEGGSPIIQNNIITYNISRGYDFYQAGLGANNGGTCYGGGIYIAIGGTPTIRNNVISNNIAQGGGGKDFRGGWSGNGSAGGNAYGGGICAAYGGNSIIVNNTFFGNKAIGGLGGSSNSLNAGDGGNASAGGIDAGGSATVKNNIFSNNAAIPGPVGGGANGSNGTADNGAVSSFASGNLSYNLYYNNSATTNPNGSTLGTNNIVGNDPLFVSDTNFHLQTLSPARKAGTATDAPIIDFDGITRTNPPAIGAFDGSGPTSINSQNLNVPKEFSLGQNFPNPFNPSTIISYQIPMRSNVTLKVYDAIGREVATLVNEVKEAGYYTATFDASNLSSGIYFARLRQSDKSHMMKMMMLK